MIVECGSCGTRFQLDDTRVPETGIRVRCSKCKQAFFLPHPDSAADQVVHDVAAEAAAEPGLAPEVTRDLGADGEDPEFAAPTSADPSSLATEADEPESEPESEPVPDEFDDDGEDDWEFNDDDGATISDTSHEPMRMLEDEDLELDDGSFEVESLAEPQDEGDEEFRGFGTPVDNLSESSVDLDAQPEDGFESEVDSAVDVAIAGEPGPMEAPLAAESAAADAIGEDLGAPEDWDFLSDDPSPLSRPNATSDETQAIGKIALKGAGEEFASGDSYSSVDDELGTPPARRVVSSVLGAIGWAAVVALFLAGTVRGLLPGAFAPKVAASVPSIALGALSVDGVRGGWVDTAGNGRVFAVTGLLGNNGSTPASAGSGLGVVMRDADGQRLPTELAIAGLGITHTQVRELPGWEYAELQRRASERFAHTPLRPGASRPFVAMLSQVPFEAAQFELEPVKAPVATASQALEESEAIGEPAEAGEDPAALAEGAAGPAADSAGAEGVL